MAMITIRTEIPAPIETAWILLTDVRHLRRWWNRDIRLDAVPGGTFTEPWTDAFGRPRLTTGEVLGLHRPREIRLSWGDPDWPLATEVTVDLHEIPGGTALTLTHGGWSAFPEGDRDHLIATHRADWQRHLERLAAYAERATVKKAPAAVH